MCTFNQIVVFFFPLFAIAAPQGLHVVSGSVRCDGNQIHVSEPSVLHWDSYSIAGDEHIHYSSPHMTLNRVKSESVSQIDGRLSSNGPLWLINPNGIVIGKQGQINAASFLASTLDVLDGDFLGGSEFVFAGTQGRIAQQGVIECPNGYVMLMSAEGIEQTGTIRASRIGIGVGAEIVFVPKSSPLMAVRLQSIEDTSNCYARVIQHKGLIEATAFEQRGGEVYLVTDKGQTEVTGEIVARNEEGKGGTVHLLGEHVHVLCDARIEAQGKSGGGTVLIGGDYQGKNPEIQNAECAWVARGAEIVVDALEEGSGGKVILWGNHAAAFNGDIFGRGGSLGGDGGFVEVSSPGYLNISGGIAHLEALQGISGTLFLDPTDITINNVATSGGTLSACPGSSFTPSGATANILNTDIQTNLGTCSVTISTASAFGGTGILTISNAVSWATANSLTLTADRNIAVNANVSSSGGGAIDFTANGTGTGNYIGINILATIETSGNITLNGTSGGTTGTNNFGVGFGANGIVRTTGSGNIEITGVGGVSTGAGTTISNIGIALVSASALISSVDGDITLTGTGRGGGASGNNGGIHLEAGSITSTRGTITFTGIGGTGTGSSHLGVRIAQPISTTSPTPGEGRILFTGCRGGSGSNNNSGVQFQGSITTSGSAEWDDIEGGGSGSSTSNWGVVAQAAITAPTISMMNVRSGSTSGTDNTGIIISGPAVGSSAAGSSITLEGTGRGTGTNAMGVRLEFGAVLSGGAEAAISITGHGSSTGGNTSDGVLIATPGATRVTVPSGTITITGDTGGSGQSCGIRTAVTNPITTTSGNITLDGTTNSFIGIFITQSWATGATSGTISLTGTSNGTAADALGVDLLSSTLSANGANIDITGVSNGTIGNCPGIQLVLAGAAITNTGSGTITLDGTSGPSSGATSGVSILNSASQISTVNGAINVTGTVPGGSGSGVGVLLNRPLVSTTGPITVSGTSNSSGTSSHGVSTGVSWTTGTSGDVTFANCTGGSGATSHGISMGAAFTTAGNVIATDTIRGGTGSGSIGFTSGSNFSSTGSNKAISITASSLATAGAAHGISLTGGTLSTTGGGAITLIGTGAASNTASHGINISGSVISSTTGSGNISLTGTASGSAVSHGILLATSNGVTSTNGAIALNGTSNAAGSNSHGTSITSNWTTGTSGALSLTGAAMNGFPINLGAATLTSSGDITFNSAVGLGTSVTITSGANLEFVGTVNATTAGAQSLILNATSGTITIGQNMGGSARLNAFQVISDGITFDANVTAISVDLDAPITVTGARILTATGS